MLARRQPRASSSHPRSVAPFPPRLFARSPHSSRRTPEGGPARYCVPACLTSRNQTITNLPTSRTESGGRPVTRPRCCRPSVDHDERPQGMLPGRERRRTVVERGFVRIVATGGVIGVATILGAVLVSQNVAGWIVGLAVGLTSVILAALLWSSRQL